MGLGLTSPMPWYPLGAYLEWFSVQLYLPALTGRLALSSDHVFMQQSSSSSVEEASAEAQGQQPDKPVEAPNTSPLLWDYSSCSCPQPGYCTVPRTGRHSQWVEGDNEPLCWVSVTTVLCPCNVWGYIDVYSIGFGGIIGEDMCGGGNHSTAHQWLIKWPLHLPSLLIFYELVNPVFRAQLLN